MTDTMDITSLCEDGDTLELPDGRVLRLRVLPDEGYSINDYDSDGRTEWTRNDSDGHSVRPSGFDGAARIIDRDNGYCLWWQPPGLDITGEAWDEETMRKEESRIRELCRYGFVGLVLELCEGKDAYGRLIVKQVESLGGIEWNVDDSYLHEVVGDMARELGVTE